MKPGSEYSARVPGSACRGSCRQARSSASGVAAVRKNSTYPGSPELCASRWRSVTLCAAIACGAPSDKPRQKLAQGRLQVELLSLNEEHGSGRGCRHLGEAGNVVDGLSRDGGRVLFIGEAAQRTFKNNLAVCKHAKGAAGKGTGGDGFLQNSDTRGKPDGTPPGGFNTGIALRDHRSLVD